MSKAGSGLADTGLRARAEAFRQAHLEGPLLVIPNAWDAASARVFADVGFPAVATTSAGVAWALGRPDGELLAPAEMLAAVRRIAGSVSIPVTADLEGGYGDVTATVTGALAAGAVGMNLEDAAGPGRLQPLDEQVARVAAARATADAAGIPFVVNARTDAYLDAVGAPEHRLDLAIERLTAYRDAGADCLFVPGLTDSEALRRLVDAVQHPVNVLATRGLASVAELAALGVRRVSMGSGIMRATLSVARQLAAELRDAGTYGFLDAELDFEAIQRLMA